MRTKIIMSLVFIAVLFAVTACSDDNSDTGNYLPNNTVQSAFTARYPGAADITWEEKGQYEKAEFLFNGKECEAWFNKAGTWMLAKTDINFDALPAAVKTGFANSFYASWSVDEVNKLERLDMPSLYLLEVQKSGQTDMTLYFNEEGFLVKEVTGDNTLNEPVVVPKAISDFIGQTYPEAVIADLDLLADGITEVDILDANRVKVVWFDRSYTWLRTQWDVKVAEVPQIVLDVLNGEAYAGYSIDDVKYIEFAGGTNVYHFELEKAGSLDMSVNISPEGEVVPN